MAQCIRALATLPMAGVWILVPICGSSQWPVILALGIQGLLTSAGISHS